MSEPLSMPEILPPESSRNGRPFSSHDRHLIDDFTRRAHVTHVQDYDALCMVCGCCWCCDGDCCAEYTCPNTDCGCNDKPAAPPPPGRPVERTRGHEEDERE